jgi:hypothetical protein
VKPISRKSLIPNPLQCLINGWVNNSYVTQPFTHMLLIEHRANDPASLKSIPHERGIEIDLRDYDGDIRLVHDPLQTGPSFEELLRNYSHRLLVLNLKCDGIEEPVLRLLSKYKVEDFFFLDLAPPQFIRLLRRGETRWAVRVSEYETVGAALTFRGKAQWCWVDTFEGSPTPPRSIQVLREAFQVALVSPELHGYGKAAIRPFQEKLQGVAFDAVCSDFCGDWAGNAFKY